MLFFGLFVLVILPIGLFVGVKKLKQNPEMADNPGTKFMIAIMYVFGGMAVLADLVIIAHLLKLI